MVFSRLSKLSNKSSSSDFSSSLIVLVELIELARSSVLDPRCQMTKNRQMYEKVPKKVSNAQAK